MPPVQLEDCVGTLQFSLPLQGAFQSVARRTLDAKACLRGPALEHCDPGWDSWRMDCCLLCT
jgi:hypothetical protein